MTHVFLTRLVRRIGSLVKGDGLKASLIRGGLGSAAVQAINRVLALVLGIVLARTLGAEGYGVYAYAFAIMSLLSVAAEAGVPTLLMREVAATQAQEKWGVLYGLLRRAGQFVTLTSAAVAIISLLVLWAVSDRLSPETLYTSVLMLLVLPLSAGTKTVVHTLMGLHRVVLGQVINMLVLPLLVLVLIGMGFLLWPGLRLPQYAMVAQLLGTGVVLVVSLMILRRLMPVEASTVAPVYRSREWLRSALPFTLIGGAGIINNYTDIIMLGWFAGSEEIGIYRVAAQGATLVAFSLQVANTVVAPQFSRLYAQRDIARLQHLATQSARAILFVALPVTLAFIFFGAIFVSWVFGPEFATAHVPLAILSAGQLVNAGFGSVGFLLNMTGNEGVAARILWQTALLNIVLNSVLIPPYGMNGAAIATAISLAVWNALLYRQVRQRLGISSTACKFRHT